MHEMVAGIFGVECSFNMECDATDFHVQGGLI